MNKFVKPKLARKTNTANPYPTAYYMFFIVSQWVLSTDGKKRSKVSYRKLQGPSSEILQNLTSIPPWAFSNQVHQKV